MWFECSPIINGARQKAWQINSHHQVSAHQMRNFPTLSQLIRFINIWIRCWASWPPSPINDRKSGQWMRFSTSHTAYSITNDLKSSTVSTRSGVWLVEKEYRSSATTSGRRTGYRVNDVNVLWSLNRARVFKDLISHFSAKTYNCAWLRKTVV